MQPSIKTKLEDALRSLEARHFALALELFNEVLEHEQDLQAAYLGKGIALIELNRLDEALQTISFLGGLDPENSVAQNLLKNIEQRLEIYSNSGIKTSFPKIINSPGAFYYRLPSAEHYLAGNPSLGEQRELKDIKTVEARIPPRVFILKNIALTGKYALLVTPENMTLRETAFYSNIVDPIQRFLNSENTLKQAERWSGEYVVLCGMWSDAFWHWMMEYVPKIILAESAGFKGRYIVPPSVSYVQESLALLGISADRIVPYDGKDCWLETVYIPQIIRGTSEIRYYPGLIEIMRQKFLNAISKSQSGLRADRRIYLARRNERSDRLISNHHEMEQVAQKFGFEILHIEDLALADQIRYFAEACALVGPHGAGFAHTLFMQPKSLVIEVFAPKYTNPCMIPVVELLQHRYYMMASTASPSELFPETEIIKTNIDIIKMTLRRELQ